ncbi:FGGY carbohydrate kinase domain-containing protein isoform X2 [Syngnathoides biaculeatus]|uniref:FGGY carbohydrate kinase domain-containing protein isoform X2 n=1 Tax=Syngnathoides biaculeatus TaxID=300417 RepID=UPI002ADE8CC6|nr:FGGY carbohydrate kinase domain-containing protein isoform X2 [Syngnathoides biaculeatus]
MKNFIVDSKLTCVYITLHCVLVSFILSVILPLFCGIENIIGIYLGIVIFFFTMSFICKGFIFYCIVFSCLLNIYGQQQSNLTSPRFSLSYLWKCVTRKSERIPVWKKGTLVAFVLFLDPSPKRLPGSKYVKQLFVSSVLGQKAKTFASFTGFRTRLAAPSPNMAEVYYVGVDVGTASVRAALVTRDGHLKSAAQEPIGIWEPRADHYVQSSREIWHKCCAVVKAVTRGVNKSQVRGIGFDATCSLVVLDRHFQPVAVDQDGNRQRNVVMWMDHRAAEQAARITAAGHGVLSRLGGAMSPEMQPPKLLWLKENLGESRWNKAAHFFDLPDFLSWKATGSLTRSLCTLVCKWTYCPPQGWDATFWTAIGLEDLAENNFAKIGNATCPPGSPVGDGLTREAAADLGLDVGTAVGASLIDAHAGGLGVIGADVKGFRLPCEGHPITSRMAMICGTSSCHMAMSERPLFVPGVWGPCLSAMVPDLWLNEGGQSATGRLMDHVVKGHAAFAQLREEASRRCPDTAEDGIYGYLNEHLRQMSSSRSAVDSLASGLHVWPDFHGNRSPLADPTLKGMVVGLSLSQSLDDLALLYLATVQALALGTLHILEAMKEAGHDIRTVFLCGGLSKNSLFVQIHANATGLPVVLPQQAEAVLVGAAVLGACAAQDSKTIQRRNGEPSLFGLGEVEWRLSWKALPHTFEDPGSNPGPARVEFTSSLRSFSPGSDGENGESGKSH